MRGVVRCDHCGAPHRRETASTRFRCDWCGGDNRVEVIRVAEELLLAADDRTRDPATRVRDELGSRGLGGADLTAHPPRWVGLWQVVNEDGEEFLGPVRATMTAEPILRALPAGPLRTTDEEPPSWVSALSERPPVDRDGEAVVEAARATFDDAESPVVLVRLVWTGVAPFTVGYSGRTLGALQILGTDRVVFESLPEPQSSSPLVKERLLAFLLFVMGAVAVGVAVNQPGPRFALELGWLGLGALYWMIRRDRDPLGAR